MLRSVLVANRGEIAVRVLRTCRRLGIRGIAVHSDADADALFVSLADDAVRIGPAAAARSYLDVVAVVDAARASGAEAVHPGYGFLSENPALPAALADAGIGWVGPSPAVIELMGDKAAAKQRMAAAGVPVVPGVDDPSLDDEQLLARLPEVGYPLLFKAVAGGGGKGMRAVHDEADAAAALAAARREATNAFGDARMIVERLVEGPRHVEVQVIGDQHGTVLHVLERDCSIQRRHQKVVEEAPAAHLREPVRARLHEAAVIAAATVGYVGAGTVEFLLDADGEQLYFLEMNTRLQVEHPVTEMVTGIDLVEQQLRVAAGEPLALTQDDIAATGHAIEVRLYAEDPAVGFLPQTGTIGRVALAEEDDRDPAVRLDSGIVDGSVVSTHYDPMLAKLVAHGPDRPAALARLRATVGRTSLLGVTTNIEWLGDLLDDPEVVDDQVTTAWLDRWSWQRRPLPAAAAVIAAAVPWGDDEAAPPRHGRTTPSDPWEELGPVRTGGTDVVRRLGHGEQVERVELRAAPGDVIRGRVVTDLVSGRAAPDAQETVVSASEGGWLGRGPAGDLLAHVLVVGDDRWLHVPGHGLSRRLEVLPATRHLGLGASGGDSTLTSPMPGSVVSVAVGEGDEVIEGQLLLVVEAMKMEHPVTAPTDGVVTGIQVGPGDAVEAGQPLVTVHAEDTDADPDTAGGDVGPHEEVAT